MTDPPIGRAAPPRGRLPIVLAVLSLLAASAGAQQRVPPPRQPAARPQSRAPQPVGRVGRIQEGKQGHIVRTSPGGEHLHAIPRAPMSTPLQTDSSLVPQDIVRLSARIHAQLCFTTCPETLRTDGFLGSDRSPLRLQILGGSVLDTLNGLQMVVQWGVLAMQHKRSGLVRVQAAGIWHAVRGTTVLFDIDSSGDAGTVYLREGTMRFPEFGLDASGRDRAWRLRRGARPEEISLGWRARRRLRQQVKYATHTVWQPPTPWWRTKRAFAAAGVAAAGTYVALCDCIRPTPTPDASGSIRVNIP